MKIFTLIACRLHNVLILQGEFQYSSLTIFFTSLGVCLTCYSCFSVVNWTQCDENRQKYTCEPWLDVCAKSRASIDFRGIKYDVHERGCFLGEFCSTKACKYIGRADDCEIRCCDYDFCNDSTLLTSSKLLIGFFVLFILVKYALYR